MGDILEPEMEKLAEYLQVEFNKFYNEATVKVVNCPDLRKAPFHLVAPGLCGNTALLEVGSLSNLFPFPRMEKKYDFISFLETSGRSNDDNFIIGASLYPSSNGHMGELIMNASFSPLDEEGMRVKNRSYVAFLAQDHTGENVKLDILNDYNRVKCFLHGNFFISEGKPGRVLEIHAKARREDKELTKVIQHTLQKYYEATSTLVGLGGTFVVHNGLVRHHLMPDIGQISLENCSDESRIRNWVKTRILTTPLVAVGTIVNKSSFPVVLTNSKLQTDLQLTTNHFHSFSFEPLVGGHYYTNVEYGNSAEYLGYFCPAKKLYRLDNDEICHIPVIREF
ncbi:Ester hydrolase C11orf54-like protein [Camponotus floridanus]|uniref:Ester hydrolase C11orf54-like protein n=2 Tax=Camponotus floridanus TaxID=104421 RepID=E2A095_CAMFO|nr:Ester hydrolase C11orf54-like protein [Camponotus floridanus]